MTAPGKLRVAVSATSFAGAVQFPGCQSYRANAGCPLSRGRAELASAAAGVETSQVGIFGNKGELAIPDYRGHTIIGGKRNVRAVQALEDPSTTPLT